MTKYHFSPFLHADFTKATQIRRKLTYIQYRTVQVKGVVSAWMDMKIRMNCTGRRNRIRRMSQNLRSIMPTGRPNLQVHIRNLFTEKETRQTAGTERMRKLPNPEKRAAVLRKNW